MHFKQITTTGHNLKSVIYEYNYSVCASEIKVFSNFRHNLLAYKSTFSISIDSIYGISGVFLFFFNVATSHGGSFILFGSQYTYININFFYSWY